MSRILIIEDELPMRTALADLLTHEGHHVVTAHNGQIGLAKAASENPEIVLLDVMMPKLDGFEVATQLRRLGSKVPILMLTAKSQIDDRVRGLDAGADDYLVKPFSTDELLARVRALFRRTRRAETSLPDSLQVGRLHVQFARLQATRDGQEVHLTAKEFAMLRLLLETPGEPISRERFLDVVWGVNAFPTTRTVDTHVAMLRSKLEPDPETPRHLRTVHGVGYKLDLD